MVCPLCKDTGKVVTVEKPLPNGRISEEWAICMCGKGTIVHEDGNRTLWLVHRQKPKMRFRAWTNGRMDVEHIGDENKEVDHADLFFFLNLMRPYMKTGEQS